MKGGHRGFLIEWVALNVSEEQVFWEPEGLIQSPYFPVSYLNDLHITFTVRLVEESARIFLEFEALELQGDAACQDYINVTSQDTAFQLCAQPQQLLRDLKFLSLDNWVELQFVTDGLGNGKGFQARYKTGELGPCM